MPDSPRQISVNTKARKEVDALVSASHPGVIYTEIDMSNSNRNAYTYERLATKQLGINLYELEYGPVVVVIKGGVGNMVVFKGNYVFRIFWTPPSPGGGEGSFLNFLKFFFRKMNPPSPPLLIKNKINKNKIIRMNNYKN